MQVNPRGWNAGAIETRFADVAPQSYDADARTVTAVISTGSPVLRAYGTEVLRISPASVDLSRMQSAGIPVLDSHNQRGLDNHLGRYTRIWFDTEKGKPALLGEIKFNDTERGRLAEGMVQRGEIRGISAGYTVSAWEVTDGDGKKIDPEKQRINFDDELTFTASRWELLEGSLVTVPADAASVIRSMSTGRDRSLTAITASAAQVDPAEVRQRMRDAQRASDYRLATDRKIRRLEARLAKIEAASEGTARQSLPRYYGRPGIGHRIV